MLDSNEPLDVFLTKEQNGYGTRLTPDAKTTLKVVCHLEATNEYDRFQMTADLRRISKIVAEYKGNLCADLKKRLDRVYRLGGVKVISSRDVFSMIEELWERNISRFRQSELSVMRAVFEIGKMALSEIQSATGLNYSKARRAWVRLTKSGVLCRTGTLDTTRLGLERVFLILENPAFILSGPYVTSSIFVDADRSLVYQTLIIPTQFIEGLKKLVVDLRNSADNVSSWWLSRGRMHFCDKYYDMESGRWQMDLIHFRMLLRSQDEELTVGKRPISALTSPMVSLSSAKLLVMEHLLQDYDSRVQEIADATRLSKSIVFRKRNEILQEQLVIPRVSLTIPDLSEGVIILAGTTAAPTLSTALDMCPLSFGSLLENIERPGVKRVLYLAAVPSGQARRAVSILREEGSLIDNVDAHVITAGEKQTLSVSSLFDLRTSRWKCESVFFDARTYSRVRKEVIQNNRFPIDLA